MAEKLFYVLSDFFLPLLVGYYLRKSHKMSETACNWLVRFNIIVFGTLLSVLSFWTLPLNWQLMWLPLFGILLSLIPGAAAYPFKRTATGHFRGSYLGCAMLSNIGLLGGLCAFFLYGEQGFAYIQIMALFQNLVFFLVCFPMADYFRRRDDGEAKKGDIAWRSLFLNWNQLPVAGLMVGMVLYGMSVPRPPLLGDFFAATIHISTWAALLPAGYSIRFSQMQQYYKTATGLIPIKFILTPLAAYALAQGIFSDSVILGSILIGASVPTGINAIILARLYDLNLPLAGAAFFVTTLFFLFLVYPLLFWGLHS
ncbi:MAG: transporter [Sporomusaceae bacterium]|nr:transporter [Sporomusaceae bacterium]